MYNNIYIHCTGAYDFSIPSFQHELYLRAFNILNNFPAIKTKEDETLYSQKLTELLEDHQVNIIFTLGQQIVSALKFRD